MLRLLLPLLLILYNLVCQGQLTVNVLDSGLNQYHKTRWTTIGVNYDILNSMPGTIISNGLDEVTLIHFEDIPTNWLYKLQGQTDFKKDYSFGGKLSLNNYFIFRRFWFPSIEYFQRSISSSDLFQRDLNLSGSIGLHHFGLLAKVGYQKLNDQSNLGVGIGIQKRFYPKLYGGFIVNYYFDYITYSAFIQCFIIKGKVSVRTTYDRIKSYDLLTTGVHFSFYK